MERAETYAKAIKAALGYTGWSREQLAERMKIHIDTLGRKLNRDPGKLTLDELIRADSLIGWTLFLPERRKK